MSNRLKAYLRNNYPELWRGLGKAKHNIIDLFEQSSLFLSDIIVTVRFLIRKIKGFSSVPCLVPFMRLEFHETGHVTACCYDFTKVKSVGNMNNHTIEQVWNSREMKRFRKYLFVGQTDKVCMSNCAYLKVGPIAVDNIRTDTEEGASLYEDISNGRVTLKSHPLRFNLANYHLCNLSCVMCPPRKTAARSLPVHVKRTEENLRSYFDKRITIYLTGNGDVLARKDTRDLLLNFDSRKYTKVTFQILTNGLLFQPDMWEKIKHNNFSYVNISIDAATRESYEKIRRGGKWEHLMTSLDVFKKAKEENKFSSVNINMVVMKSNFREIPQFIEMARARGFNALFTKIRGEWDDENIFTSQDNGAIGELKKILSAPGLYGSDVDMIELAEYIPAELRPMMGNHLTSIWYPSYVLKSRKYNTVSTINYQREAYEFSKENN